MRQRGMTSSLQKVHMLGGVKSYFFDKIVKIAIFLLIYYKNK
jgi:hypothetical protein